MAIGRSPSSSARAGSLGWRRHQRPPRSSTAHTAHPPPGSRRLPGASEPFPGRGRARRCERGCDGPGTDVLYRRVPYELELLCWRGSGRDRRSQPRSLRVGSVQPRWGSCAIPSVWQRSAGRRVVALGEADGTTHPPSRRSAHPARAPGPFRHAGPTIRSSFESEVETDDEHTHCTR